MTVLLCPLCSQPRFTNLESLRVSLVNAATQSISCPICDDILMGLDKLTIHLFGHTLNQNIDGSSGQRPTSLELKTNAIMEHASVAAKPDMEEQYQNPPVERREMYTDGVPFGEAEKLSNKYEENDKFFSEIQTPFCTDGEPKIFQETPVRNDNLCTVNMEDLSFLTSWENSVKPKQDHKEMDNQHINPCPQNDKQENSDLSEYMSDLLNKKMPILNFSFTVDNVERGKSLEKEPETDKKELKCGTCGFAFQNPVILSMHEELVHFNTKLNDKKSAVGESKGMIQDDYEHEQTDKPPTLMDSLQEEKTLFFPELLNPPRDTEADNVASPTSCENQLKMNSGIASNNNVNDEGLEATLPRYDCHLCSKSFKMRGSLLLHFRVAHFALNTSDSLQVLGDVSSPEERNHPCPICNKCFKKEQHLSQHVKTHEGKQWQCETCNKLFTTKYFLKKHQRLHTGEMPYSCLTCKKTFTFQQSYHKHLLYHSDEKPHQCTQCGRSFKELSTLHNHQRIHSGEKPFACETCGKCFRQRVSYIVHQRIHTGVLPYQCTACKKKFRYKVSQRSHKCTAQPPGVVVRQSDIVQKILETKHALQQQNYG